MANFTAFSPKYITTGTTTLVRTGPGVLHSVVVNKPVASATITICDAITNTNAFAILTCSSTATDLRPFTMIYDCTFNTGLSITTSGATDITVNWAPA